MNRKERSPLLSARVDWILLEILIIFSATMVYSVIIWIDESQTSQSTLETFKVTVKESVSFFHYTLIVVIGTFELIGAIMIYYTILREKLIKQGIEQGREEGREEVTIEWEEAYKEWYADWEKRKQAATEKGIEFNDPPPPRPSNNHR